MSKTKKTRRAGRKHDRAKREQGRAKRLGRADERTVDGHESRGAIAATVMWMLVVVATLLATLGAAVTTLLARALDAPAEPRGLLSVLPDVFRFTAVITATLCMLLTVVVHSVREYPPPRAITVAAILLSLAAWGMMFS